MVVEIINDNMTAIVKLCEHITFNNIQIFIEKIQGLVSNEVEKIYIDCENIYDFQCAQAVGVIISAKKHLNAIDKELKIRNPGSKVINLLKISNVLEKFDLVEKQE